MNNTTIIIRIHFAVTLFQHSPLTRRVFYNNIRRERGNIINNIRWVRGQHHQYHLGTLTGVSINHWKFFSSSTQHIGWSIINTVWSWSSIIILIGMRLSNIIIIFSMRLK
jgi:hypothetical protein